MDIAENLKNHVAKYEQTTLLGVPIENIQFRNPTSSNYYMSFLAIRGNLIVTGDAYDGIYEVSCHQTMKWWSHCDACYLSSKLRGLNGHPDEHQKWDYKEAEKEINKLKDELRKEVLEEYKELFNSGDEYYTDEAFEAFCKKQDEEMANGNPDPDNYEGATARWIHWLNDDPNNYNASASEWGIFLNDRGEDYFGNCDLPYEVGYIRNPQIDFHLEGLKLAVKQLEEQGIKLL